MRNCGKKRSAGIGMFLLAVLGLSPLPPAAQTQTARDHFETGTKLARQGEHYTALQQFNKALAAGMQTAALYYNIGVTCYRLGYLNQAASAFKQAADSPKMAGLAYYNLGLIAQQQNNTSLAEKYFRRAEQAAQTENLRKLSRHARETLKPGIVAQRNKNTAPGANRGLLWIEINSGYDDNVLLVDPEGSNASGEDDTFTGMMVFGHYYASGNRHNGLRLYGLTLLDRHAELDSFDLDITAAGADYSASTGQWRHNVDIMLLRNRLGGDELENIGRLAVSSTTGLRGELRLKLQLEYETIDAASAYSFLEGRRKTGEIALSGTVRNWKLEYSLEDNDRNDYRAEDGRFQSFSPRQHELTFEKQISLSHEWELELEGTYMQSRYRDANVRSDGTQQKRRDKRATLSAGLYKAWIHNWRLGIELGRTDNVSNFDESDYTRQTITLTLDKAFRF